MANDGVGRPVVDGPVGDLWVSIAHTEWVAVAAVSDTGPVGVDIEVVAPKDESFVELALTARERTLGPRGAGEDEWVVRAWTAKEAVAKARGTGLQGRPTAYRVEEVTGDTVVVRDPDGSAWRVATCRAGDYAVAVTIGDPVPSSTTGGESVDTQDRAGQDDEKGGR